MIPAEPAQQPIPRPEPLREAVYARIVDLILNGHYPPGAALTEASLSRALDVSRTPVREALLRLEAEGVLSSSLARGFTVRPLVRREVVELYPILGSLEALAVRTARPLDPATLDALRETFGELARCTDPVRRWRLDTEAHGALVAASGNGHLMTFVRRLRTNVSRYELTYMREAPSREDADRQHVEIVDALAACDPSTAAAILEQHWHDGMRVILDWLDQRDS
ncbi:GntR family transcriptional regulator [Actinomadura miaoliensis]|uniref:GntR family transcriptional regulator n=1 Tax=Actinomadura miaoliensis TaxID=430685 RepID=A0ABP7W4J5_9ACTN